MSFFFSIKANHVDLETVKGATEERLNFTNQKRFHLCS